MLEIITINNPFHLKYAKTVSEELSKAAIAHHLTLKETFTEFHAYLTENEEAIGLCKANQMPTLENPFLPFALFKREDSRALLLALSEEIHLENFVREMKIATESKVLKGYLSHYFQTIKTILVENLAQTALEDLQNEKYDACMLPHFAAECHQLLSYKVQRMNVMAFIPECGEGIMGIFGQEKNKYQNWFWEHFHHKTTEILFQTEMAFQTEMHKKGDYNCFGFATSMADSLSLTAGVVAEKGEYLLKNSLEGQILQAEKVGKSLAFRILENL